eukprot:TRINITY_DN4926_c0_g1_i2.p2 TRINITY_DN4926_c0_g1~~TRINITY_DN4926_c0_g1_i2.p2  ORF type:complete len:198 (-),score=45.72 TRINITY_DN4926_c0_g1_i2:114-707(-)
MGQICSLFSGRQSGEGSPQDVRLLRPDAVQHGSSTASASAQLAEAKVPATTNAPRTTSPPAVASQAEPAQTTEQAEPAQAAAAAALPEDLPSAKAEPAQAAAAALPEDLPSTREADAASGPPAAAKASAGPDRRVDPVDGQAYTFQQIKQFYKGTYNHQQVVAYWNTLKPKGGKVGGGKPSAKRQNTSGGAPRGAGR